MARLLTHYLQTLLYVTPLPVLQTLLCCSLADEMDACDYSMLTSLLPQLESQSQLSQERQMSGWVGERKKVSVQSMDGISLFSAALELFYRSLARLQNTRQFRMTSVKELLCLLVVSLS